jgi:hypothetical protein
MAIARLINRAVRLCGILWVGWDGFAAQPASAPDPRNFANGWSIPVENYCDQPRIVVTKEGTWVCVLTTNPGKEGAEGQHVVTTLSEDQGKTWSPVGGCRKGGQAALRQTKNCGSCRLTPVPGQG